jgi:hypothetical protein
MRRKIWFFCLLAFLPSCSDKEESANVYFMTFDLRQGDSESSTVKIRLENTEPMNGNDILNTDQASIGFHIYASFTDPENKTITQTIHFYWSREVPKDEVTFASNGIPVLKDPGRIKEFIPRTNLFHEQSTYFGSYIHENTQSFCTAGVDTGSANSFRITDVEQYVDSNNKEAMDIAAEFSIRFVSACDLGDKQIANGALKAKILM